MMLVEAIKDEDLATLRLYPQRRRAHGHYDFRTMLDAKASVLCRCAASAPAKQVADYRRLKEPDSVSHFAPRTA